MLRHLAFFTLLCGARAEGGRGSAVSSSTWQSTQHLPSDYVPSAGRASVNCSRFVVITSQRSGSRYFMDKLKSHASIRTAGEIFSHDRYKNTSWSAMHSEINRHMATACAYHHATTVGFKWMLNQGHDERYDKIKSYFRKSRTKLIFLWRRNEFRRILSLRALATQHEAHLHSGDTAEASRLASLKIEMPAGHALCGNQSLRCVLRWRGDAGSSPLDRAPDALVGFHTGRALVNQLEKDAHERKGVTRYYERDAPHQVIFYEDVIESSDKYAETFARIFKFIGVPEQAMEASKNVAIHSDKPMLASVANAKDVLETLIFCCACKPDDAIGADKRPRNYAHPCCSVTAALCDDVDSERLRLNATGPARDMKTLAKSKVQKALWQINDPDAPLHLPLRAPHHKNAFVAAAEAMAAAAPAPSPRPTTTTRTKGMTYFQRLAADAEAARQKRLERLRAEAKAAEEAGALGLKSEAD